MMTPKGNPEGAFRMPPHPVPLKPLSATPPAVSCGGQSDDFLRKSFWVYDFYPNGSQIGDFTGQKLKI